MDLLEMLMGVGGGQKRQEYEDFVNRYEKGPPWEGYTDQEVADRYGQVAHKVSSEDYEAAARDAFARLSPEERAEFARYLRERASQKRVNIPGPAPGQGGSEDPGWLAKTTRELHEQPGQLRDLLGEGTGSGASGAGSLGSLFASPLAKAALAGITAMVVKRMMRPT